MASDVAARHGADNRKKQPILKGPHQRERLKHKDLNVDAEVATRESNALRQFLRRRSCLPGGGEDESNRRATLHTLEQMLCQWASSMQSLKPKSDNKWQRPRISLISFGSYRLGVHRPESDLDVLALAPPGISRRDFFSRLTDTLRRDDRVQDVHAIPFAYTPVLKFVLNGFQIDMLFGQVQQAAKLLAFQRKSPSPLFSNPAALEERRQEYEIDDSDFAGMDEAGVRSLNGVRVSQDILHFVRSNPEAFRVTLCAVKEWAIIKGVYSNMLGFLGGVNFAILVAWICRRYPNQKPTTLLKLFFRTFSLWKWPAPVSLRPPDKKMPRKFPPGMQAWDPRNPRDAWHLMPILTPSFPAMNSAYNVGIPQRRRLQEEMTVAARILAGGEHRWKDIFKKTDFFSKHSNYLQVTIRAPPAEDFLPWRRFCESRLRLLITALESAEVSAWPFSKVFGREYTKFGIVRVNDAQSDDQCMQEAFFFIGLRFSPGVKSVDLRNYTSDFLHKINSWEGRKEGMDLGMCHVLQSELPKFVFHHDEDENSTAECGDSNNPSPTNLTPQLSRARVSDSEIVDLQSPTKKQRTKA